MEPTFEERFWAKVDRRGDDDCWPWLASLSHGYGQIKGPRRSPLGAHRVAYELLVGPIPEGLTLDHLCHTRDPECTPGPACLHRRCVNPAHLEVVSASENTRRGVGRKTHCAHGHPWVEENIYRRANGRAYCRLCHAESAMRAYWEKQR